MNIFENKKSKDVKQVVGEGLNLKEQEKWAREARKGLTREFLGRVKFLQDAISKSTEKAVIDGNFNELNMIVRSLGADVDRLQENYNKYWKDLDSDKKSQQNGAGKESDEYKLAEARKKLLPKKDDEDNWEEKIRTYEEGTDEDLMIQK